MGDWLCGHIQVLKEVGSGFLDCCSKAMGEKKVCYFLMIDDWGMYVCGGVGGWVGGSTFLVYNPTNKVLL